jgi:transcriptional regulator with XRE-family HTH domain
MERGLYSEQLQAARHAAGLTQQQASERLDISQAYLALLERGRRPLTSDLEARLADVYNLGPLALPLRTDGLWDSSSLAAGLASLGYPGFRQLDGTAVHNPATILLAATASCNVEVRVIEALPWLAVEYCNLNWEWLIREVKIRDVQNRLGFIVTLARQLTEKRNNVAATVKLCEIEATLDRARLVREDTLCQDSLSAAECRWLKKARPAEARHWNLLTDLSLDALRYAA